MGASCSKTLTRTLSHYTYEVHSVGQRPVSAKVVGSNPIIGAKFKGTNMSNTIAKHNFEIYAGDACEIVLVYKDSLGAVITSITKATITLKTHYGAVFTLQKVATLDAPNGKMTFTFTVIVSVI